MSHSPEDSNPEDWEQTIVDPEAMARLRRRAQQAPPPETGRMQSVAAEPAPMPVPDRIPAPMMSGGAPDAEVVTEPAQVSAPPIFSADLEGMADECTLVGGLESVRSRSSEEVEPSGEEVKLKWGELCRIHPMFLESATPARGVELVEQAENGKVFRWIIGPEFKMGRSPDNVDYVTWLLPRNVVHDAATRTISRCHVTFRYANGSIGVHVGDVCNGVSLDGFSIPANGSAAFCSRGVLHLAGVYQCRVQWDGAACGELRLLNLEQWAGSSLPLVEAGQGAVTVRPLNSQLGRWDATWILSGATFGADPAAAIVLPESGLDLLQGWIISYRGCVGLLNCGRHGLVEVNGHRMAPGDLVFLSAGHRVSLGHGQYQVNVLT
jgi:hypothetical protein